MRQAVRLAAAAAIALAAAPAVAAGPTFTVGDDGTLLLGSLPEVLSRPEVRPHLTSGLTTSFVVEVTATATPGEKRKGAARIDVRWEPWDEVFHLATVGADRRLRRATVDSYDRLVVWWQALELPVVSQLGGAPSQVKVELSVLPFSQSEQLDAQRWFAEAPESEARAGSGGGRLEGDSRLEGVVDLFIATSIQRQAIVRYAWTARPRRAAEPKPT